MGKKRISMEQNSREPAHFSLYDFLKALFGSFVVGLTFLFKGSMIDYSIMMKSSHVITVIIATCLIVTLEIYALSYRYVTDRKRRPFYEFWTKRFFAITISSFAAIYLTLYIYGFNDTFTQFQMLKLTSAIFMPAAIIGAAIEMLKNV